MGGRIPHATLKGPNLVFEIGLAATMGLIAGFTWKQYHWNEKKKARHFYDLLERGKVTVVSDQ